MRCPLSEVWYARIPQIKVIPESADKYFEPEGRFLQVTTPLNKETPMSTLSTLLPMVDSENSIGIDAFDSLIHTRKEFEVFERAEACGELVRIIAGPIGFGDSVSLILEGGEIFVFTSNFSNNSVSVKHYLSQADYDHCIVNEALSCHNPGESIERWEA